MSLDAIDAHDKHPSAITPLVVLLALRYSPTALRTRRPR